MFSGKEKCFLGQLSPFGTSCSPSFRPSIQHWSSILVSFPFHRGFSLVLLWITEAPTKQEAPSIHQLSGLACYFLGMPRKFLGLPLRHVIDYQ
jgi:hypothetical protein